MTTLLWLGLAVAVGSPYSDFANAHVMTASDEYRISRSYVELERQYWEAETDPAVQLRAETIASKILATSDRPDLVLTVLVLPDPSLNAFAMPGGFLVVHQGLMDAASDEILAFVLGHELAHVILRHTAGDVKLERAHETLQAAQRAMAEGNREAATASREELEKATLAYGRELEFEADIYGMIYAVRAGYGYEAALATGDLLEAARPASQEDEEQWSTHPTTKARQAEIASAWQRIQGTVGKFDKGVTALRLGNYEGAIAAFDEYLATFPNSAAAWSNLATAHLATAGVGRGPWIEDLPVSEASDITVRSSAEVEVERARRAALRAADLAPDAPQSLALLALLARREGDAEAAVELLTRALSVDPDSPAWLNNLAVAEIDAGRWDKADEHWQRALELAPERDHIRYNRALAAESQLRMEEAIDAWQRLSLHPYYGAVARKHLGALGASAPDADLVTTPVRPSLGSIQWDQTETSLYELLGQPAERVVVDFGAAVAHSWDDLALLTDARSGALMAIALKGGDLKVQPYDIGLGTDTARVLEVCGAPALQHRSLGGEQWSWPTLGMVFFIADDTVQAIVLGPPEGPLAQTAEVDSYAIAAPVSVPEGVDTEPLSSRQAKLDARCREVSGLKAASYPPELPALSEGMRVCGQKREAPGTTTSTALLWIASDMRRGRQLRTWTRKLRAAGFEVSARAGSASDTVILQFEGEKLEGSISITGPETTILKYTLAAEH